MLQRHLWRLLLLLALLLLLLVVLVLLLWLLLWWWLLLVLLGMMRLGLCRWLPVDLSLSLVSHLLRSLLIRYTPGFQYGALHSLLCLECGELGGCGLYPVHRHLRHEATCRGHLCSNRMLLWYRHSRTWLACHTELSS